MEYVIGFALALAVVGAATMIGLDRERSLYPTVLIVIASHYVLFAMMGGPGRRWQLKSWLPCGFSWLALLGFKKNLWLVAAVMAGHGAFDFVHHFLIENRGVPHWWPGFCLSFDAVAGGWLAVRLTMRKRTGAT